MTTSEKRKYRLLFLPQALAEWKSLDGSVKENLKKLLAKRLDNPHVPGGELHGELSGHYKIKLNKQGVRRLVYAVEDDVLIVMVMSVDRREDSIVYKSAVARMAQKATTLAKVAARRQVD